MDLARGFTLIELLLVITLIAIASALVTASLRDPQEAQLQADAVRLSALLESARAEARASGVAAYFELRRPDQAEAFRFVGLGAVRDWPTQWLQADVSADIVGGRRLTLGPEPVIGAQRIQLRLGERRLSLVTDGLAPFAVADGGSAP